MSDFFTVKEAQEGLAAICGSGKISKNLEKLLLSAYRHIDRIVELEAENSLILATASIRAGKLEAQIGKLRIEKEDNLQLAQDWEDQFRRLEKQLDAVEPLPDEWRKENLKGGVHTLTIYQCANELDKALEQNND